MVDEVEIFKRQTKEVEIFRQQNERVKWIISGLDYDLLTDWEQRFIESVERQSDSGRILSDETDKKDGNSQMEVLERIYQQKGR